MDVYNNVLEGTRQYFMGVPKQVQEDDSGQPVWPAGAPPPEEGTPALSGAPAPSSRPPSAAAAPTIVTTPVPMPPRPPSEPLEPKPHIIHKATVMREAAEKRREIPDIEDEEEPLDNLSPPSHFIHKPPPTLSSPAAAPAAPCPSPARPPSAAPPLPLSSQEPQLEPSGSYRAPIHHVQTPTSRPPEHFAPSRPPDPYSSSRPPEQFRRYYEQKVADGGRTSHGSIASPQPSLQPRQSYSKISTTMPQHMVSRFRDAPTSHSPPAQRYAIPVTQPPPPHNDRVPPIHHPQTPPAPKLSTIDARTAQIYPSLQQRRESSPYARTVSHYDRHPAVPSRKYDPQQVFPGYRPTSAAPQPVQNHRVDTHHQNSYKHLVSEAVSAHYSARSLDRSPVPPVPHIHDGSRLPTRSDFVNVSRNVEARPNYPYPASPASTSKYTTSTPLPVPKTSTLPTRPGHRAPTTPRSNYDYTTPSPVQTSPARSITKPGYPGQPARPTVSVTSIVNEMNQTKQKRESPLDLSVKTVKNSADSSTTQDDVIDSATSEHKIIQAHPSSSSGRSTHVSEGGYVASLKVDFNPNFSQYGDRTVNHNYTTPTQPIHPPLRFNGSYETSRSVSERYPIESPHQSHTDVSKYSVPVVGRTEYVPRHVGDNRHLENRIRDDRSFKIEERKRPAGPIVSNIPEKIVRYETWVADSRIQRMVREQDEVIRQPIYNYNSHKQYEAYHNDYKRATLPGPYRDHPSLSSHRYPSNHYPAELPPREPMPYHPQYLDRNPSLSSRNQHGTKRFPSLRDVHPHHLDLNGVPVENSVKSILRSNLETKQSGFVEPPRISKQMPDLIILDDIDDSVIEIPDDSDTNIKSVTKPVHNQITQNMSSHIQMPKAVDSLPRDSEYHTFDNTDTKRKSPENDVASRIRTKAELKVMPPSQDSSLKGEIKQDNNMTLENDRVKIVPKSQKQHLFNQIREDNLRLESVIKSEKPSGITIPEVKSEPMNIDEIERDAEISIKTENIMETLEPEGLIVSQDFFADDLDWSSACDSFMEQLKSGCHKKKLHKKRHDTLDNNNENKQDELPKPETTESVVENSLTEIQTPIVIKQEPVDKEEINPQIEVLEPEVGESTKPEIENEHQSQTVPQIETIYNKETKNAQKSDKSNKGEGKNDKNKSDKKSEKDNDKTSKGKLKMKTKTDKNQATSSTLTKKESKEKVNIKTIIKEESESTDDDEPLIKSKILKEKEQSDRLKYQLLKDLSEKSAYVKLECCDVDVNKNNRKSLDSSSSKDKDDKSNKIKVMKQTAKTKLKKMSSENIKNEKQDVVTSSDSDDESLSVASRLRIRKSVKSEEKDTNKTIPIQKTPIKSSPSKKVDSSSSSSSTSNSSTPVRKPDFGDGSAFHPGWEEELYKYKRSLRMPTRLIAIPRGRSGGPFIRRTGTLFTRGSTSLPDLDHAPLSPAPSSAPSAATDDLCARRQEKLTLDSDLDSNSSCSARHRLHYDSEASTSTVFSSRTKRKGSSIVDVLIQKCVPKDNPKKKTKDKDEKTPRVIIKKSNTTELLPTPSLGLVKNGNKGSLSAKKEKHMEDIYYLGAFRKETVTAFRNAFIKNTDGLIGATEEFKPVVLKTRTRTESRVLKHRATIKEVFGDERPASAPPTSCIEDELQEDKELVQIKIEPEPKPKLKPKKIVKDKMKRRSSSIRDGLRSTKSLKRNDAKGRLLRLKKRNSLMKSFKNKRNKDSSANKHKTENVPTSENNENIKTKEESSLANTEGNTKRRIKRLFGRRKFSSGFDYIRKKKKIIRREEIGNNKIRRPAVKPSPESIHDIHKEIKSWFINKSVGETHLHRAARLGYTDCVAYCLEKMESDPTAKDNAGFTPLHVAAAKGHVRIARLLLQYGANVSAAAQGGIRPLHEACENCHVEVIRLLLAYGADPLLGTYAGQTPEELTEGTATIFLRLHIADVQGKAIEPWRFPPPTDIIDREELGCDPLASPPPASPPPPPDSTIEIQSTEAPLPPFYSLRTAPGQPADGLWCLLQDITNLLQIKSKDSLLKQIHCGSGSPKELLREIRTQEFLERAQCHQLLCAGEKVNVRASKVALVRVTDKLRQLLKIETVLVS